MVKKTTAKERKNPEMGKRLKQARESLGLSQKEVADQLALTTTAYQNYEYGREISSGRLIQICAVLECSPNWLLGYHDQGMHLAPDSLLLKQLKDAFNALNEQGQQEAVKRARELTKLDEYTEKKNASAGDSVQEVAE